jgi:predicted Zn-dependent peptidase
MKVILAALALAGVSLLDAAGVSVPVERFQLANGLRVIVSPDPAVPVVSVYIIYNVGARSEEKGRTGFAHLFEHMMFQGSANVPRGKHFATVEANGGTLNGSTHADYTDYFETMPSNKLATALWLESDRMRSLSITDANLTNQKEAVKQERRLRMDNQPYVAAIAEVWPSIAFRNWGSSHSLIGSFEDLNAATVDDVARFFRTYYAPNNAVMALAGNVTLAETKKLVEAYFGDIPSQPQPKHPDLAEPPGFEPRTEVYKDKLARVPGVVLGFPGPVRRSPDFYALAMVDAILTAGDSSRLQLSLVKGKQSVVQYEADLGFPFGSSQDYKDPGMYAMLLLHQPKFTATQIVDQVQEEIAKLQNDPVPAADLERVKAVLRASRLRRMQTTMTRAQLLAQHEMFDGKAELINTELERMLASTPAEIQAAARKYLTPDRRLVLQIVPAPPAPAAKKEAK